ncbi:MAG: MerR family transcriptional regulator [Deltaproteobacteria bacterium]|nr:MerR family transcriptional regulator [Deltaproteobacteria bacterium]
MALRPRSATVAADAQAHEAEGTPSRAEARRESAAPAPDVGPEAAEAREGHRAIQIPDRRYFRIGEVADLLGVRPHVLRYWETEFKEIKPQKSQRNQRLYRRRDVEVLVAIRKLLYEERFTIAGAREQLRSLLSQGELETFSAPKVPLARLDLDRLEGLRDGLSDLLALLDRREADLDALE